ncbi:MAG: class I SAM-dependent methyltransferase [Clostridiales bacterium]|nr:class I SAM-dependent methyltransferase [Clostridiales bacterium]MBS5877671.1 class I SAM-dependent methyltransferase [Clostridiales bacterium]MDU0939441.1 class I SAM-dependent methyltransferase [Clostridiales bacterium]MDU1041973.1 class I SAM-dependent methyltransferase [Clostridiales bacterium]MDU3490612.1 class I SAM-dependent methyltransferase [Clostridiales bacterium]
MALELGHEFLARMGKTRLRPGGVDATDWLIEQANFRPDMKVLEVACNMGTTMIQISGRYGCHFTGLDLSEEALSHARENIKAAGLEDKIDLVQGSAFELPFEDNSFDVVINEAMLTMLLGDKKDLALSEYHRVLKPGGLLLTHDVYITERGLELGQDLLAGLSRAINMTVEPLPLYTWKDKIESHGFTTTQKYGPMTLMKPEGMIHDEGEERAKMILANAHKEENLPMFTKMFEFFTSNDDNVGYVANFSIKK